MRDSLKFIQKKKNPLLIHYLLKVLVLLIVLIEYEVLLKVKIIVKKEKIKSLVH
jgi:hypothetical protein